MSETRIIINGERIVIDSEELTYAQIVARTSFALPAAPTVTYRKGHENAQGSLSTGQSVKVKDGMVFNVTRTDNA